jgi:hypothetical protein
LSQYRRALKPNAQAFDEVRIKTVPRWKTSGLSGDEWRISARIEFLRNGIVVHDRVVGNIEYACYLVGAEHITACDDGKGYFAGDGDFCDQEGCGGKATVTYKLKKTFCREGHEAPSDGAIRKFCNEHKKRGDCGLEDADRNYEKI